MSSDLLTIGLLVALEGLLSADNAMVLAVLVLGLPRQEQQKALRYGINLAHQDTKGTYADGGDFYSPSACSQLVLHSSGRLFWIGNIAPQNPNGKVIVFSHGSVGLSTDERVIKAPIKFLNTAKFATEYGYTFVTFMRKGRGSSEGDFTEQLRDCSWGESNRQHKEAELQLEQVIRQVQERYGVKSVVLMGHSRGGLLSAHYADRKSTRLNSSHT